MRSNKPCCIAAVLIKPFEGEKKKKLAYNYDHFAPQKHWGSNLQSRRRAASLGKGTVTCRMCCVCHPFVFHVFPSAEQKKERASCESVSRGAAGSPVWCGSSVGDVWAL